MEIVSLLHLQTYTRRYFRPIMIVKVNYFVQTTFLTFNYRNELFIFIFVHNWTNIFRILILNDQTKLYFSFIYIC